MKTNKDNGKKDLGSAPEMSAGGITRRTAMVGGMAGLLAGVLQAKTAAAQQVQPQPLLKLGGLCEGGLIAFKAVDAAVWMQQMLTRSASLQTFRNHFTASLGVNFILQRAKVYLYAAPAPDPNGMITPFCLGILPSFKTFNRSDPSHEAVGITVAQNGGAIAASVVVNHNPFRIALFRIHEIDPDAPAQILTHEITADQLATLSAQDAAAVLGVPKVYERNRDPNAPSLSVGDGSVVAALAYQTIIKDTYARPLYPVDGFNSMLSQTPLVSKFAEVNYFRYQSTIIIIGGSSSSSCNGCSCSSAIILPS